MPLPDDVVLVRVGEVSLVDSNGALLTGKKLVVTPTEFRLADGVANAIVYAADATAVVDSAGTAWVTVPATDNSDFDSTFNLKINEPDNATPSYFIEAPSTAPIEIIDGIALPTIHLSQAVKAPEPVPGILQIQQGPAGSGPDVQHRAPTSGDGNIGDAFIDTLNAKLYGPKTSGGWGTGTNIGTGGAAGADGRGIASVAILGGDLIVTYTDADTDDAGIVRVIDSFAFDGSTPPHLIATYSDATTDDLGDLGLDGGGGGGGGGGAPTDLTPPGSTLSKSPANVKDQADPNANAIMDGSSHPLSTRFANLTLAQLVFPGAAALTDEIDYWAIQTCLNNNDVVDLSYGTAVLHKSLQLAAGGGQTVYGHGRRATVLQLRDTANTNIISHADPANANPNIELRDFSVDGNRANNTAAIGQTDGISLVRCDELVLDNIEVHDVNGRGIHHQGLTGSIVNVQHWTDVYCHHNLHWGIWNTNGVRKVFYTAVTANFNGLRTDLSLTHTGNAADNFTGGMLFDHSESEINGLQCHNNSQDGLWIRNVFACTARGIRATQNGRHGIRVLGLVDSVGSEWGSWGNGVNTGLVGHDIWFDGTSSLNYGVTAGTKLTGLVCGPNNAAAIATQGAWTGNEDYAAYFDDNMTSSDLDVSFKVTAGTAGTIRYPSAGLGLLRVNDGSGLERVELFTASGAAITLGPINTGAMKRINLTANCVITLPLPVAGQVFTCNVIQPASGGPFTPTFVPADGIAGHMKYTDGNTTPDWTVAPGGADRIAWLCDDGVHQVGFVEGQNI